MAHGLPRILEGSHLPARLGDLEDPPARLYLRGDIPRGPAVAIVGTRQASADGESFARRLAADLTRHGIAVFSGGALGIDTQAHLGALDGPTPTMVVAPAGFERPCPESNGPLFRRIVAQGGAHLSLLPDDEPAPRHGFFARNACLVALAHAVVVVEARYRSGARNAARWARRLGRPLLAVPASPWHSAGAGCNVELRLGARLCVGLDDVLTELERALVIPPRPPAQKKAPPRPIGQAELVFGEESKDPEVLAVVRAVRGGAGHLDAICAVSGLSPAAVQSHVLTLTLEGVLVADPALGLRATPSGLVSARKHQK